MKQYILLRDRQESGPFTAQQLRHQQLAPEDLVWVDGESTHWQKAGSIAELSEAEADNVLTSRGSADQRFTNTAFETAQVTASPLAWTAAARERSTEVPTVKKPAPFKWLGIGGALLVVAYFAFTAYDKKHSPILAGNTVTSGALNTSGAAVGTANREGLSAAAYKAWGTKAASALRKVRRPLELKKGVSINMSDYETGFFGGISNLEVTVKNTSAYAADRVKVKLEYLRPNNDLIETKTVTVKNISAGGVKTVPVEDTNRGVRVNSTIISIQ